MGGSQQMWRMLGLLEQLLLGVLCPHTTDPHGHPPAIIPPLCSLSTLVLCWGGEIRRSDSCAAVIFSLHYPAPCSHPLTPEHFLDSPLEPVAQSARRAAAWLCGVSSLTWLLAVQEGWDRGMVGPWWELWPAGELS